MSPVKTVYDSAPSPFYTVSELLEPVLPAANGNGSSLPLPPFMLDLEANSPHRRAEQALEWVVEAQQVIASQQERIAYLESLTMTDELTGLLNRRGLFNHFHRELAHAERSPAASGVAVMIDLDGFKTINDTLGHDTGDAMLRQVSALLSHLVRPQDVVARLGGDEFVVLLTGVDATIGLARAADIVRRLNGETVSWHGRTLPITLSFGAVAYGAGDHEEVVLRRADAAMYADKGSRHPGRHGRHSHGTEH
jgi:diguanylate cyclase (GGDEF)-like protein